MNYYERFNGRLQDAENRQSLRRIISYIPIDAVTVEYESRQYIMMASNNYLGLTHDRRVIEAAQNALALYGSGSGGARLISGTFPLFEQLECELARYKHTESALVFNTGYMANVGTISALADSKSVIFSDDLNHASIIDGCRLSKGKVETYHHCDPEHLAYLLQNYDRHISKLIVTDGVFSMDGDVAPLPELYELSRNHNALLMVDDAHATGTIGHGTADYFGMSGCIDVQLGTLSKALGSVGGFVAGRQVLIDYLVNFSRSFIFSTALSPADIGSALKAVELLQQDSMLFERLHDNIQYMARILTDLGISCDTVTPIFPVIVGDNAQALRLSEALKDSGVIVSAIRPPTVPVGESRLRLTVTAAHQKEQLDYVGICLKKAFDSIH